MIRPDPNKVRETARRVMGADPEPPPGLFDDEPPVDAYEPPAAVVKASPAKLRAVATGFDVEAGVSDLKSAIEQALEYAKARLKLRAEGKVYAGAPSGFVKLDKAIDGWQRQRVYLIGGRTGMGKSIVGLNVGLGISALGEPVAFMSLEMSTMEQAMRMLFAASGVESWRWKQGVMRPEDWSRMYAAAGQLWKMPWLFDDTSQMTVEQFRLKLVYLKNRVRQQFGKELYAVVLDHVLLFEGSNPRQPRREQVDHITRTVKALAKEQDVCMIALTQLNRALEARSVKDKRPQISDLRESGSSEQDADVVALLYRADYYRKDKSEWDNILEMILAKVRDGEPTVVRLQFSGGQQRVSSLSEDDDDEVPEAQRQESAVFEPPTSAPPMLPPASAPEPEKLAPKQQQARDEDVSDDELEVPDVDDVEVDGDYFTRNVTR